MTTRTVARGSDWGIFANHGVYADWGDCGDGADSNATYTMLGDMVANRFNEIARENNCPVTWIPQTSEVIGPANLDLGYEGENKLDEWRRQATEEIATRWNDGDIEPVMLGEAEL